nr:odorant binding protein 20 [Pagiophloeus tsushimanus]
MFSNLQADREEDRQKLKNAHDKCQADPATAIDEDALKTLRESKGKGASPPNGGAHALCVSKSLGWQNADGSINKDHLKERISANVDDAAKVDEIFAEATVEKENETATAEHLFKVFFKYNRDRHDH